jgi:hypothetical protein
MSHRLYDTGDQIADVQRHAELHRPGRYLTRRDRGFE